MDKLIDKLPDILDKLPDILDKLGNLFGFFALLALFVVILSYILYNQAERTEKNRAFILILLFFFGLVLAALTAGVFSGFRSGRDTVIAEVKKDPSLIKISPGTVQKLEGFISLKGQKSTEENKAQHLEKALEAYLNPSESSPAPPIFPSPSPSSSEVSSSQPQEVESFIFESQECTRTKETRIKCAILITNKEKRRLLFLNFDTRAIDSNGKQYNATYDSEFSGKGEFNSYLVQDVGVRAELVFEEVPTEVNQLTLIELSANLEGEDRFTVQLRNIPIAS